MHAGWIDIVLSVVQYHLMRYACIMMSESEGMKGSMTVYCERWFMCRSMFQVSNQDFTTELLHSVSVQD